MKTTAILAVLTVLLAASCARTVNLNRVKGVRGPGAPAVTENGVRFSLFAPDAFLVTVAGNFNGWDSQASPLTKDQSGLWTATLPLKPGQKYYYKFFLDGYAIADPDNPEFEPDGSGGTRSVVVVR